MYFELKPIDRTYPYTRPENTPNEYEGIECFVLLIRHHDFGAENAEAFIRMPDGEEKWVPFEQLVYQCCSECGY